MSSVPAFSAGGMNVTGLQLVDSDDNAVRSYLRGMGQRRAAANTLTTVGTNQALRCKVGPDTHGTVIITFTVKAVRSLTEYLANLSK